MKNLLLILLLSALGIFCAAGIWLWLHLLSPPSFHPPQSNPTLSLIVEPTDGIGPVLSLINNATISVDLVMYDLEDTEVEKALVAAESRGVSVRVLLNRGYYGASSPANQAAYDYLQNNHVPVHWTPSYFSLTHEKLLIVDANKALIMGFNLTPKYYATSRDFALYDSDSKDVDALVDAFGADWNGERINASQGDDLLWSPDSENELIAFIKSAQHSILIYNEEMSNGEVIQALKDAASRGVSVYVIMTYESTWKSAFLKLVTSGVHLRIYPANAALYIHAKMIIVDNKVAFVGSQNFSATSLNTNRELGIFITNPLIIDSLATTFGTDWHSDYDKMQALSISSSL